MLCANVLSFCRRGNQIEGLSTSFLLAEKREARRDLDEGGGQEQDNRAKRIFGLEKQWKPNQGRRKEWDAW